MQTSVYLIRDPTTKAPRYIGVSDKPQARLRGHIAQCAKHPNPEYVKFFASFLSGGELPLLEILFSGSRKEALVFEEQAIAQYVAEGHALLNIMHNDADTPPRREASPKVIREAYINVFGGPPFDKSSDELCAQIQYHKDRIAVLTERARETLVWERPLDAWLKAGLIPSKRN